MQYLVSVLDEGGEHAVEEKHLPAAGHEVLVDAQLSVSGHGELEQVGVVAALAKHHEHTGHLDVQR